MPVTKKFHRTKGQRHAFFRGLANNLIMKEKMETTEARAKAIRPIVERLVSIARRNRLQDLRLLISRLDNKKAAQKLFHDIAPHLQCFIQLSLELLIYKTAYTNIICKIMQQYFIIFTIYLHNIFILVEIFCISSI